MQCTVPHVLPFFVAFLSILMWSINTKVDFYEKENKPFLLIWHKGWTLGPYKASLLVFNAVLQNSTFLQPRWNAFSSWSSWLACEWHWQVQFVCHSEHGMPKVFRVVASVCLRRPLLLFCTPPPPSLPWRCMTSNLAFESASWTEVLDDAQPLKCIKARVQSDGRKAAVGGASWVFVCFESESSVNKREMRRDDCDVTIQHD